MKSEIILIIVFSVVYFIVIYFVYNGLNQKSELPGQFHEGQCVQMLLDNRQGMVTYSNSYSTWIRFANKSISTNTRLLGNDGDLQSSPYSKVIVNNFEIKECDK